MTAGRNTDHVYHREWRKEHPVALRGEGVHVEDDRGRRFLDAVGGVYVVNVGHGLQEVADAMAEQARRIAFPYAGSFTTEAELDLAEAVIELAPPGFEKVFFVSGGSEANEVAFKLARKYQLIKGRPERWRILGRWQSYHGSTMATLSAGGKAGRRTDFLPYLHNFPHVDPPYCYRCPWGRTYPGCGVACADAVERLVVQEDPNSLAAVIAEPITGAASGAIVPPPEYFPRLREICDRHDLLLIVDEVITGFGRTGADFAIDHWGVVPDLITCGKGIGSGYAPLGAVLIHERIHDQFLASPHGSVFTGYTYAGHPVTCAAGLAVLRYLRRHDLVAKAREDGAWFFAEAEALRRHPTVGDIRGKGLLLGIEFVADAGTRRPFAPDAGFMRQVVDAAWDRGLIVRGETGTIDGTLGEHILLAPPLVATRAELARILELLDEAIGAVEARMDGICRDASPAAGP
jgi:adenosylmethionine-8-amino-7-oxononanoate aminotransferase